MKALLNSKASLGKRGKNNPMYGVHRYGEEAPFYKKTHTDELKKNQSIRMKQEWEDGVITIESLKKYKRTTKHQNNLHASLARVHKEHPEKFTNSIAALTLPENQYKAKQAILSGILNGSITQQDNAFKGKGFREDLQRYFRSRWEANQARVFDYFGIKWEYESAKCRFNLGDLGNIIIDFYLVDLNYYIEVQGFLREKKEQKLQKLAELYPQIRVDIIDYKKYLLLASKFSSVIDKWER